MQCKCGYKVKIRNGEATCPFCLLPPDECVCPEAWTDILNGMTLEEVIEKYYLHPKGGVIDYFILQILEEHGAADMDTFKDILSRDVYGRLRRMVTDGNLNLVRIPYVDGAEQYHQKNIYYLDTQGFKRWLFTMLDTMPAMHILQKLGMASRGLISTNISRDMHRIIKEEAAERGTTIRGILESLIMKHIEGMP